MERPDPLKVFLGSLKPEIAKPCLESWMAFFQLNPVDIFVPDNRGKPLAVAFCTFSSAEEAQHAVHCFNGLVDADISAVTVKEQRVAIMEVFIVFRSLSL